MFTFWMFANPLNTKNSTSEGCFFLGKVQSMQVEDIEDWKNEEVICYCRSGNRSGQACMILDALGFSNTKNLAGGMLAWKDKFGNTV